MANHTRIQDISILVEFRLSEDEEQGKRVLRLARLLPGFRQGVEGAPGVQIQMPLAEAGSFRDVLLDLWTLVKDCPGSIMHLGDRSLPNVNELKKVLVILDCATAYDLAKVGDSYCKPAQGYNWGCLYLQDITPVVGHDGAVDRESLRQNIQLAISQRQIFLCQHFNDLKCISYVVNIIRLDGKECIAWNKNKEMNINRAMRNIVVNYSQHPDLQRAIPVTSYDDVGGLDDVVQVLKETVELQLKHPEIFAHLGITPHRGVLLYGPPGCGKTLLARAVAHESGAHFFPVSGPELITKWHGESEENLRNLFVEAQKNQPSVVFFDEIDAIAQSRSSDESLRLDTRFTTQLLTLLDGIHDLGRVAVLATTNRIDLLDPALLRPGRFDRIVEIPPPDREGRRKILQIHAQKLPVTEDVNLEVVADALDRVTGADIAYVVREAAYSSLKRSIELNGVLQEIALLQEDRLAKIVVNSKDFSVAINNLQQRNSLLYKTDNADTKDNKVES